MKWSMEDIERLKGSGKIRDYTVTPVKVPELCTAKEGKICKLPDKEPLGLGYIKAELDRHNIPYITEHRFSQERKFRFDIALPVLKIAIEYEGVMSKKSRHTTSTGYTRDATKYNLAQQLGWKVYRYTTQNYKEFNVEIIK